MSVTVKLRKIGNSPGLILPKEVADQMHVTEGDTLHVVTDANNSAGIDRLDPALTLWWSRTKGPSRDCRCRPGIDMLAATFW